MSETTAYHEAGHVWMALYLGGRVRSVTIDPDRDDGPERFGETQIEWRAGDNDPCGLSEKSVLVALAGPVAEMIHRGEPFHPGFVAEWAADWQEAWSSAAPLASRGKPRLVLLERLTVKLHGLLHSDWHWAAVAAIVDQLLAHETLEGSEVEAAVAPWLNWLRES